jgi:para-nitrobenzyl esterase
LSLQVETTTGVWQGRSEARVLVFRGMRYGAPPMGALRFRESVPAEAHLGVREAIRDGTASLQRASFPPAIQKLTGMGRIGTGEDCLHLNVTTPGLGGPPRPVLVWIHGGGFHQGSGGLFLYRAHGLARRGDVVVVTLNYRLGLLGAWPGPEDRASGIDANLGLSDQLLALEWVRDNIAAFGGDPGRVTVFGQSAGAMSIATLLAAPRAEGLFQRAVLQSGAADHVSSPGRRAELHAHLAKLLALDDTGDVAAQLRALSPDAVLAAQDALVREHRLPLGQLAWQPGFGTRSLPEAPLDVVRRGGASRVPLLIGTNLDEWRMFTAFDARRRNLDEATLHDYVERTFEHESDPAARRREVLAFFELDPDTRERRTPAEQWAALQTARVFSKPALDLAEAQASAGGDVWTYRFDWRPMLMRDRLGACHSMEIPFVFGSHDHRALWPLIGALPAARALSRRMQDAWVAFARGDGPETHDIPDWPRHTLEDGISLRFAHEDALASNLGEEERQVLSGRGERSASRAENG